MVSHYDCEKQHNLRQFNLPNVKQCTEAPSNIQHANIQAQVYVRAKTKRIRAFKCEAYAKKEQKNCFQGYVKYRRVDRTVWNHNTMPLPITLDPLGCKNLIRHLNGTDKKIFNNLNYNETFTLLEDHYFQEQLERFFKLLLLSTNLTKCIQVRLRICLLTKPGYMTHFATPTIIFLLITNLKST